MAAEEPRTRGLQAVEQAREARTKMRWPSPKFWGYTGLVMAVAGIIYWRRSQAELDSERQALMAKQRAVKTELGPRWDPMRDKIEAWTIGLANDAGAEHVETLISQKKRKTEEKKVKNVKYQHTRKKIKDKSEQIKSKKLIPMY